MQGGIQDKGEAMEERIEGRMQGEIWDAGGDEG